MKPYHKIPNIYKRNPNDNYKSLIVGEYTKPEFEYLTDNTWIGTEKVDGTNIRIMWDGDKITFGGKTDNAQMPVPLLNRLQEIFLPKEELFHYSFPEGGCCLYGEGYGAGIQRGGCYLDHPDFVLFDVNIKGWWLDHSGVGIVATELVIPVVPTVMVGTLTEAVSRTREGFSSKWGDFVAEGMVLRPKVGLADHDGQRIITKIKHKDFT